ncbi:alcohol oxidase [Clavulina sp. PMI_390]|nr:alcohol oxidase [Clavulina sp. PMI_390]
MITTKPEEFVTKYEGFDYVVIGGGTAGLVVAARLSEDPNVTVGVLEAGSYHVNDPLIDVPGYRGRALGNDNYDWAYLTVPQRHLNNRVLALPRGKMLGGTSALNFMSMGRTSKEEYDAFESVGNPGWNWESLLEYFKKSETVHPADKDVHSERHNAVFDPSVHGTNGPIHKSFGGWVSDIRVPFFDALEEFGVHRNPDAASGFVPGSYPTLSAVDPATAKRSSTASGYYAPNASRPNLVVLTSSNATKMILTGTGEPYTISGVEFSISRSNQVYEVKVKREVILSAGAFGTPQLLELSGFGRKTVLDKVGIEVKVELPGVGENLQDHLLIPSLYEISDKIATLDVLRDVSRRDAEIRLYEEAAKGIYSCNHGALAFLPASKAVPPSEIDRMKKEIHDTSGLDMNGSQIRQKALLEAWLDDERHPQIEMISSPGFFPWPGKTPRPGAHYHTIFVGLLHPVSRGSVHIGSTSPLDKPVVDPNYFSSNFDRDLLVHALRFVKKLQDTEPLKSLMVSYVEPAWKGEDASEDAGVSDDELREYIKNGVETINHPIGTAAMFPREEGGVVDAKLKVYGTTNLRVIDASVIPFHIAAHPVATIIAMAEKAADIFKADARR